MTKPTRWPVRPTKTQISLGIRLVWSESSLSAWRNIGSSATHWVCSEDPDQTGWMPRLIWVFAEHTCHCVDFFMWRLNFQKCESHFEVLVCVYSFGASIFSGVCTCPSAYEIRYSLNMIIASMKLNIAPVLSFIWNIDNPNNKLISKSGYQFYKVGCES